jgi:hypothetical protein
MRIDVNKDDEKITRLDLIWKTITLPTCLKHKIIAITTSNPTVPYIAFIVAH